MAAVVKEPPAVAPFRKWLLSNGAVIHEELYFHMGVYGLSVYTKAKLPRDSQVVSCPFGLIITSNSCQRSLFELCVATALANQNLTKYLRHGPYLSSLPAGDTFKTPLHYSNEELELLRGTNIYSAAIDRRATWESEWKHVQLVALQVDEKWSRGITWERYLCAATYISSRAFPSSLLSTKPSLNDPTAHPVLIPLVDVLNHARAVPVSWAISMKSGAKAVDENGSALSLILHGGAEEHSELYNNYGAKSNSEFLLGYGFTLPSNPNDTMAFKLPDEEKRWEIGRKATGDAQDLFGTVKERMKAQLGISMEDLEEMDEVERIDLSLEATDLFQEMLQGLRSKLPTWVHEDSYRSGMEIRPEILEIVRPYIEGQYDILDDLSEWSNLKRDEFAAEAKDLGVEFEG